MRGLILGLLVFFSQGAVAQEVPVLESSPESLESEFQQENAGKGVFLSLPARVTAFGTQPAVTQGVRAGWVYGQRFAVGMEGHVLLSPTVWHPDLQQVLSMTYGGLFAQGLLGSHKNIHGLVHVFWGFGEAHYRASNNLSSISEVSAIWMVEAQAMVAYSPFSWLYLQAGPGFRFAPGASLTNLNEQDFWRPYAELSLALGFF